ncbi:MAG TPA: tetratricopeptide repeat-containing protein [Chthoniobacteraceae bacterium]|nr:tetratricopeptide repeat-containing protein [Chthoniobacteraceae bacterium]
MTSECDLPPALRAQLIEERHRDPLGAFDRAKAALEGCPGNLFLRQVQAGALAQTGSPSAALEILHGLYGEGHRDAETLGLLGSAWKQIASRAPAGEERTAAWRRSLEVYLEGLSLAESAGDFAGYYPAINAAALRVWLGEETAARDLARRAVALTELAPAGDYWVLATRAEAALIGRRVEEACALYLAAQRLSPPLPQIATTRRQARRLGEALGLDLKALDSCFHVPPVLFFAGHLTDAPGRATPRFTESMAADAARSLHAAVARTGGAVGFASAARGGDVLFLEALQMHGIESRVVLPLEVAPFHDVSVAGADPAWHEQFTDALGRAKSVRIANSHSSTADGTAFEYGARILLGLARLEAQRLETELRALVLWDGRAGDGVGGTAWVIGQLLALGATVENVYPGREGFIAAAPPTHDDLEDDDRPIRTLLFSDCMGYSKLREEQIAEYTRAFLTGVARLIELAEKEGRAPLAANTWGDGLFFVFADPAAAAAFALSLRDAVRHRALELAMPPEVRLRIALHAGPVTPFQDPITGRPNFAGMNVAFAARIEPIVPENQVCVSEAFAALAAEAGLTEFRFDYLGVTHLHKEFGRHPVYQLRRRGE